MLATKKDICNSKESLISELRKCKWDIIKWMFFFSISQLLAIIIIIKIFN